RSFIHAVEIVTLHEAADKFVPEPAPGPHAYPADVLHGIAQVSHLPVEDALDFAIRGGEEVARAVVGVYESDPLRRRRQVVAQPAESTAEDGLRLEGVPVDDCLP